MFMVIFVSVFFFIKYFIRAILTMKYAFRSFLTRITRFFLNYYIKIKITLIRLNTNYRTKNITRKFFQDRDNAFSVFFLLMNQQHQKKKLNIFPNSFQPLIKIINFKIAKSIQNFHLF